MLHGRLEVLPGRRRVSSIDVLFLRELLRKVEAGECGDVLVIATDKGGGSFLAGPGLDRQLSALSHTLKLTPQAEQLMTQGPLKLNGRHR